MRNMVGPWFMELECLEWESETLSHHQPTHHSSRPPPSPTPPRSSSSSSQPTPTHLHPPPPLGMVGVLGVGKESPKVLPKERPTRVGVGVAKERKPHPHPHPPLFHQPMLRVRFQKKGPSLRTLRDLAHMPRTRRPPPTLLLMTQRLTSLKPRPRPLLPLLLLPLLLRRRRKKRRSGGNPMDPPTPFPVQRKEVPLPLPLLWVERGRRKGKGTLSFPNWD